MDFEESGEPGHCFDCGAAGPWIILIAGEDEQMRAEWACEKHARGHWRLALVTPPEKPVSVQDIVDAW
jgi:hypothetical protein